MRMLLIANTIFEIGIGCVFLFFPTLLTLNSQLSISLLRVIGCGALSLGTLSFLMLSLTDKKELKPGLIALSIFHSLVAVAQIYSFIGGMANTLVIIIHSLFAVSFITVSWQRIR
ncbi:hypothetical protein H6G81_33550 [Scytonema hofmannii FACHB-248]|jgi:hypothetical protein|uniref:Uncharacterized protein n=1 Tax=Scytonema hofmannii FACHB-248 TaxID=1842502 RepID=A0ABR8H1S7_9CYAN|nr:MULTISPECIES: hypothetical protein [Nostocales]MBD2609297.1 hypothetical protein [Scytonema hofmannii FACHB-248]